jgi:hypothetical protein
LLELPAIVETDRVPRLLRREGFLQHGQRGHQRSADPDQGRHARETESVEHLDGVREPLDRRGRLGYVQQARSAREIDIVAPAGPCEQCIPALLLPVDERPRSVSPIAGEVRLRVVRKSRRKGILLRRDPVNGRIGDAGERHGAWIHLAFD